jgi:hypothetical protein
LIEGKMTSSGWTGQSAARTKAMVQDKQPAWSEGKAWLYRGYQVTHGRDGKTMEVRKGRGPVLQNVSKPVTYQDLTALIDKLHVSAR